MNVKYFPIKYFVQKWYFKSQHLPKTPKYLYHKNRIISIDFTLKSTGGPKSEDRPRSLEKDHFNGNLSFFFLEKEKEVQYEYSKK